MNDYLIRAVDREMSGIPAVRPALPSLFETGEASAIVAAPGTESPIESERPHAHSEFIAANSPVLAAPLAAVNALWVEAAATTKPPRITEVIPAKPPNSVAATPVVPSTVAESLAESRSRAEQPEPAEPVVRPTRQAPSRRPLDPATVEPVIRPATGSAPSETRAISKSSRDSPIVRAPIGDAKAKSETPPAVAPMTPAVRPAVPTVPPIIPASSRSDRTANSRAPRGDPSSPRAIHITIGRIEVRAVHPPPEPLPQQRPAPASPKISLDEYLKQRNGARR
jgi:hypothetical protein